MKFFHAIILGWLKFLSFSPTPSLAAQNPTQITINPNLPGTYPINSFPGLIANFYSFALVIAGVLAFGAIVYGGIKYATGRGNPSRESEGKSWITNALLGLLLLGAAYIILRTINPQLVSLQIPGLPQISAVYIPGVGVTTAPPQVGGGTCAAITDPSNPCSVSNVQSACSAWDPNSASQVCDKESGGGTDPSVLSGTDKCGDGPGGTPDHSWSIGIWQINVFSTPGVPPSCTKYFSANKNPSGPTRVGCGSHYASAQAQGVCLQCATNSNGLVYCNDWSCSFSGNDAQYNQCVSDIAASNNQLACNLYTQSKSFCPWANTAKACSVSPSC
jgi:Type IV secretion system pilin